MKIRTRLWNSSILPGFLGLLWIPLQSAQAREGTAIPPEAFKRIAAYAEQSRSAFGTPGMAIAVTSGDQLLFTGSFGCADLKSATPVDDNTLFQIGSIAKAFTGLALLMLHEEGKVDLDAPVTDALPWFSVQSEFAPITPRHLLTNTAGIPSNRDDLPSSPYMAIALRDQQAAWEPGSRFSYSNVGYQVLSVLLETVAGQSWQKVVQDRILDPLGMSATEPAITYAMRDRQATGYIPADATRPAHRRRELAEAPFFEYSIGDGCIVSSATDMTAFVRLLLQRGQGSDSPIASDTVFDAFIEPGIPEGNGSGYGCGIAVDRGDGQFILSHYGGMVGHLSAIAADLQSGYGFVILMNGPGDPYGITVYALKVLRAASCGQPLPDVPSIRDPFRISNAADYAGTYQSTDGKALAFEAVDDNLLVRIGESAHPLEQVGYDSFYCQHPSLDRFVLQFQRDEEGQVVTVAHGARWFANDHYNGPEEFTTPQEWQAYTGRYHSQSPWFPGFSVFIRQGKLWCVTDSGGETTGGNQIELRPLGDGVFRPADEPTPDRVIFEEIIDGRAWRATWSGHRFYRAAMYR